MVESLARRLQPKVTSHQDSSAGVERVSRTLRPVLIALLGSERFVVWGSCVEAFSTVTQHEHEHAITAGARRSSAAEGASVLS